MATSVTNQTTVSPTDALWALYQSQTKKVRKAFLLRILSEEQEQLTRAQQAKVKGSLTRAFDELRSGKVHPDAHKLFAE